MVPTREKKNLERKCWENMYWYLSEGGPLRTKQASQHSILCTAISCSKEYRIQCAGCFLHNGPPSPKFQILHCQLRQTADRAAGLSIKSLWSLPAIWNCRKRGSDCVAGRVYRHPWAFYVFLLPCPPPPHVRTMWQQRCCTVLLHSGYNSVSEIDSVRPMENKQTKIPTNLAT